jgi:AAA domain/Bifunctional DNA primase/polymerase, N-terminal
MTAAVKKPNLQLVPDHPMVRSAWCESFCSSAQFVPVHPVKKRPLVKNWPVLATDDLGQVRKWFCQFPEALLGVTTGKASGFWVLDVDGERGTMALAALEALHGKLPKTRKFKTPNGARLIFAWVDGLGIKTVAGQLGPGLDVRGGRVDGSSTGQTIWPDSERPDGGKYKWTDNGDIADAPCWLLFFVGFTPREREMLAKAGITGPEGFGELQPAEWQARARELLRSGAPAELQPKLDTDAGRGQLERYLTKSITGRLDDLAKTEETKRDTEANNAAWRITGLLQAGEVLGLDTTRLDAFVHEKFQEVTDALMGSDEVPGWAVEKLDRCAAKAHPATISLKTLGTDPDDEFETLDAADTRQRLHDAKPAGKAEESGFYFPDLTRDPAKIPPRPWLFKGDILRKNAHVVVAAPGVGKSALSIALAVAGARGDGGFLRMQFVGPPIRTLIVNSEDDADERERRIAALCKVHGFDQAALNGWIAFYDKEDGAQFVAVTRDPTNKNALKKTEALKKLTEFVTRHQIGQVVLDPFRSLYHGNENDSGDVDFVASALLEVMRVTGAAGVIIHHTRKNSNNVEGAAGDADAGRGSGALTGRARKTFTLNRMLASEARDFGIEDRDRLRFIRLDDGKPNQSAKSAEPKWYELVGEDVGNDETAVAVRLADLQRVVTPPKERIGKRALRRALQAAVGAGQGVPNPVKPDGLATPLAAVRELYADAYRAIVLDERKKEPTADAADKAWRRVTTEAGLPIGLVCAPIGDKGVCIYERDLELAEHFATDPDDEFEIVET